MDAFSYYKDSYFHELQRKDQLNGSLSFPVGIVTLLGGLTAVIAKAVSWPFSCNERVLLIFLVLSVFCLVIACFYLVRSYWGHPYRYMPFSEDLLHFEAELKGYYNQIGKDEESAKTETTRELSNYVVSEYAANAKFNAQSNERKSAAIFKANAFVISAMITLACTAPSYLYEKSRENPEPLKVQLVSQGPAMTTENDQPAHRPERQEAPPVPIVKPIPPPSREIKEHVEKPRT